MAIITMHSLLLHVLGAFLDKNIYVLFTKYHTLDPQLRNTTLLQVRLKDHWIKGALQCALDQSILQQKRGCCLIILGVLRNGVFDPTYIVSNVGIYCRLFENCTWQSTPRYNTCQIPLLGFLIETD